MKRALIIGVLGALVLNGGCSPEQGAAPANSTEVASTPANQPADADAHAGMKSGSTGDPDADFLRGMIPHHQGAIDMARIELEHGRDPAVRAMAQRVIDTQAAEIAQMRTWLAQRGVDANTGDATNANHR